MVGERLAGIRSDHDDTQGELAEKLNVSVSTVRSWEHNHSAPSNEILVQICKMYGVSADYLLGLADSTRITPTACTKQNLPRASAAN